MFLFGIFILVGIVLIYYRLFKLPSKLSLKGTKLILNAKHNIDKEYDILKLISIDGAPTSICF
jgi:hypothetical protein